MKLEMQRLRWSWPQAAIDQLRELWSKGVCTREIADQLETTRNAVIGKARRLNLEAHALLDPHRPKVEPVVAPTGQPCGVVLATAALERGQCRYPHGDPKDSAFHYCTARTEIGRSYCKRCARLTTDRSVDRPLSKRLWTVKQRKIKTGKLKLVEAAHA